MENVCNHVDNEHHTMDSVLVTVQIRTGIHFFIYSRAKKGNKAPLPPFLNCFGKKCRWRLTTIMRGNSLLLVHSTWTAASQMDVGIKYNGFGTFHLAREGNQKSIHSKLFVLMRQFLQVRSGPAVKHEHHILFVSRFFSCFDY